jgi:hypothetical protein
MGFAGSARAAARTEALLLCLCRVSLRPSVVAQSVLVLYEQSRSDEQGAGSRHDRSKRALVGLPKPEMDEKIRDSTAMTGSKVVGCIWLPPWSHPLRPLARLGMYRRLVYRTVTRTFSWSLLDGQLAKHPLDFRY